MHLEWATNLTKWSKIRFWKRDTVSHIGPVCISTNWSSIGKTWRHKPRKPEWGLLQRNVTQWQAVRSIVSKIALSIETMSYHLLLAMTSLTDLSPLLVATVAWLMSGYWVDEWFPQMMTFFTSLTRTFSFSAIWPSALLWSSLVRHVMFFSGIEGANSFRTRAFVFAGLATTRTCRIQVKKKHLTREKQELFYVL